MIMKQTVEEAAWQELMSSYAIVVKGEFAYQRDPRRGRAGGYVSVHGRYAGALRP